MFRRLYHDQNELIDRVLVGTTCTRAQVKFIVEKTLHTITRELAQGNSVQLIGFGTFEAKAFGMREVKNPRTGEPMTVPPHMRPIFRAGKALKEAVKS